MWFTENPWPPLLICAVLSAVACAVWISQKQSKWLLLGVAGLLAAGTIWYVEQQIVTEREKLEGKITDLVRAFEQQDQERVLNYFSPQAVAWRAQVVLALKLVKVEKLDVKDVRIELVARDTEAITHFRANGRVAAAGMDAGHQPSRWKLTWRKEKGEWKIIDVIRLNPLKDEPMDVLERRAQ